MIKPTCSLLFIILLLPLTVFSQIEQSGSNEENKAPEEKKPEIKSVIKIWDLNGEGAFIQNLVLDTLQDRIQIYHPIYKNSITDTYTGNYAGAYLDNNFFSRTYNTDFLFLQTHDAYLLTPKNIVYYNTTTPYTYLDYSQSGNKNVKNETRFNVLHSRNINPDLNVTFMLDEARSDGQYNDQATKNNFVSLYSSYISDRFNFHGGFIFNRLGNDENGGMKDDNQLFNNILLFNLVGAHSDYKSDYFYATTEFKLGGYSDTTDVGDGSRKPVYKPRYSAVNYLEYSSNLREFTEGNGQVNRVFFPQTLIDTTVTDDRVRFNKLTNIFQVEQLEAPGKKYTFGKRGYFGIDLVKTLYPGDSLGISNINHYTDLYVGGGIFRESGKFWNWNFEGRLYMTGYHSGQTELSGDIYKPFRLLKDSAANLEITGRIENRVPDFFQHEYYSNHKSWYNSFNHEQRMIAGIALKSEKRKFELGGNYALINNFIFNDTLGIPSQTKKELLILSAYLNKKFVLGKFNLDTRLLGQKASSSDLIHLPEFSAYMGIYYKLLVSKVLYTQIGVDTRYNTKYYADAYDPSTGFFYLQNEKKLGNYPYIDVYASLKLVRTRVYFKFVNIGSEFLKEGYFTALHYPMNKLSFRLGVDWKFYD